MAFATPAALTLRAKSTRDIHMSRKPRANSTRATGIFLLDHRMSTNPALITNRVYERTRITPVYQNQ